MGKTSQDAEPKAKNNNMPTAPYVAAMTNVKICNAANLRIKTAYAVIRKGMTATRVSQTIDTEYSGILRIQASTSKSAMVAKTVPASRPVIQHRIKTHDPALAAR